MNLANIRLFCLFLALGTLAGSAGCRSVSTTDPGPRAEAVAVEAMSGEFDPVAASAAVQTMTVAYPTGNPATSTLLLERSYPREVLSGREFTYKIRVENLTAVTLEDVIVTDRVPETLKVISQPDQTRDGNNVHWALGELAPGAEKTITATAVSGQTGPLSAEATARYSVRLSSSIDVVRPDLSVSLRAPSDVLVGDTFPVEISVTNNGIGAAKGVRVSYDLQQGLVPVDGRTTWDIGALTPGQPYTLPPVTVRADTSGEFAHVASVTAGMVNGVVEARSPAVAMSVRKPQLSIAMRPEGETPTSGRPGTYEITVQNTGDGIAKNALARFPLPRGLRLAAVSDGGVASDAAVTWILGDVEPRGARTVRVTLVNPEISVVPGVAFASADRAGEVSCSLGLETVGVAMVTLEVRKSQDVVAVGDYPTCAIRLKNVGSARATDLRVTCTIDDNVDFDSSTGPTPCRASGSQLSFEPYGALEPGRTLQWFVRVKADESGDAGFTTKVTYSEVSKPLRNDTVIRIVQ